MKIDKPSHAAGVRLGRYLAALEIAKAAIVEARGYAINLPGVERQTLVDTENALVGLVQRAWERT